MYDCSKVARELPHIIHQAGYRALRAQDQAWLIIHLSECKGCKRNYRSLRIINLALSRLFEFPYQPAQPNGHELGKDLIEDIQRMVPEGLRATISQNLTGK